MDKLTGGSSEASRQPFDTSVETSGNRLPLDGLSSVGTAERVAGDLISKPERSTYEVRELAPSRALR